jgi:uncharacterized protein DUF1353
MERNPTRSVGAGVDRSTEEASGFPPDTVVDVEEIKGKESRWRLLKAIDYQGETQSFRVHVGESTDFASVPRVFVWFLPRYGKYTAAAILHDHLWGREVPGGHLSRLEADAIFRRAMRQLEVPFLRRWIMWAAVRWGALTRVDGRKNWWKEGWRVLLITALALPIVGPPAVLIGLSLGLFFLVEFVVYLPLKLNQARRSKKGLSVKRVNRPEISWKL